MDAGDGIKKEASPPHPPPKSSKHARSKSQTIVSMKIDPELELSKHFERSLNRNYHAKSKSLPRPMRGTLFCLISLKPLKISTENIEMKNSLDFEVHFESLCSVEILSGLRDISRVVYFAIFEKLVFLQTSRTLRIIL